MPYSFQDIPVPAPERRICEYSETNFTTIQVEPIVACWRFMVT